MPLRAVPDADSTGLPNDDVELYGACFHHEGDVSLPENETVTDRENIEIRKGLRPGQVREGRF